ncbi:hypothetical protein JCM10450v2_004562 [Rhodotorula kratochvilovae]
MPHSTQFDSSLVNGFDDFVKQAIADLDAELRELSLAIHAHPELAWEEHHAHDLLTAYMDKQEGFTVTRHAYDLATAWSAVFTSSSAATASEVPTIGFNSEMDALKGLGHGCGHNLIAISGCASAIATARALEHFALPGRVVLLGTPAEEAGGGKVVLLERGAYDGLDACLMVHPGTGSAGRHGAGVMTSLCIANVSATFHGAPAHAGAAPEKGVNALDAAVSAYSAINALRQQLPTDVRVHGIILGGDEMNANVIPSRAQLTYGMRAPTAAALSALVPRILRCFAGAALTAGCTYTLERNFVYLDVRPSAPLARAFKAAAKRCWDRSEEGSEAYDVPEDLDLGGSTDFGNVTYACPALHPMFFLPGAEASEHPHSETYAATAKLPSSHEAVLRVSAALAVTALEVLRSSEARAELKREWEKDMRAAGAADARRRIDEVLPKQGKEGKAQSGPCCCSL